MRHLLSIVFATLCFASQALALSEADSGVYAVVHRDGNVTSKVFRVRQVDGLWRLEDRKPDGRWEDVTCTGDCKLRVSSQTDIQRFFSSADLAQIKPSCIHNMAFAFCGYTSSAQGGEGMQGYVLVALVTTQPIHIRLARARATS